MPAWFEQLVSAISAATSQSKSQSIEDICDQASHHIPDSFTLSELSTSATAALSLTRAGKKTKQYHVVLGILACLRCADGKITQSSEDSTAARELALLVARVISPMDADAGKSSDEDEDTDFSLEEQEDTKRQKFRQLSQRCRTIASPAITTLQLLAKRNTLDQVPALDDVFLTLVAYTTEEAWATATAQTTQQATALLDEQLPVGSPRDQFIVECVLQRYLRPLFSKSKPSSITASGRKAAYSDGESTRVQGLPDDSSLTKPWKFTDYRAIPVVQWAVDATNEHLISKHWPLFIPVLLTLVDDSGTNIRSRGLTILTTFLAKFPDKTLHDTGLTQVFEQAIFPTLSFLPSLTPEDESVRLLVPAFEALRSLAHKQSTFTSSATKKEKPMADKEKENKMLDRLLRKGVFPAYFHAKHHIRIVETLCHQSGLIIRQMGIHAVKHLKDLIPMISATMTDPFAPLSPITLLSAITALQTTISTCWPRLSTSTSPWQDEIINALVLSWLNVVDHETTHPSAATPSPTAEIKKQLILSASALNAVLKTQTAVEAEAERASSLTSDYPLGERVAPLVSKEPLLAGLFSQGS